MESREQQNERIRREVERYNSMPGNLNSDRTDANGNMVLADGIDCPVCKNRGSLYVIQEDDSGIARWYFKPCECMARRMAVKRIRESGLDGAMQRCTFDTFKTETPWQVRMRDTAMQYIREGVRDGAWLYVGGQSGAGKSHLCTAVAGVILRKLELRYVVWPRFATKAKAVVNDTEEYEREVEPLRKVRVLYIDDMLKPAFGQSSDGKATNGDIRLAFDILNARYIDRLPTIISSEWHITEIAKMDQAIAGRIAEMCGPYRMDIKRDDSRNYRLRDTTL